jgi:SCP1.201-like deaminase
VLKLIVRVGLVIAVVVVVVAVFHSYHRNCQTVGMGVADADEDCLHQDAISTGWAEAQQQLLAMSWAPVTTGLLFTEATGEDPITLTSGQSGEEFQLALQYLQTYPSSVVKDRPQGQQAAGHAEAKAAALMRHDGDSYGVLVINNPDGPCPYVSDIGCEVAMRLILPKGSTLVVWWPGGKSEVYEGTAQS